MNASHPADATSAPKPKRSFAKYLFLLVLALVAFSWALRLCHFPGNGRRAFAALPEGPLVGEFTDLPETWAKTLHTPLFRYGLRWLDIDADKLAEDPGILWLIRLTTGHRTVACLHEATDGSTLPVLSAASYGGWRTPILRFLLATRWIPGLGRLEVSPNGSRYLRLGSKRHPSEFVVGFSLRKDILLASLSKNPDDVLALERRVEEKTPANEALTELAPWKAPDPAHPYRFWFLDELPPARLCEQEVVIRRLSLLVEPLWQENAVATLAADCRKGDLGRLLGTSRISGRTMKAESLAASAAELLVLLPPGLTRQELDILLFNGRRPSSPPSDQANEEDAILYVTKAPYGSTILKHVPLPAATLYCPGIALNATRVQNRMAEIAPIFGAPTLRTMKQEGNHTYQLIDWLGRYGRHKPLRLSDSECGAIELPADGRDLLFCTSLKSLSSQRTSSSAGEGPWKGWLAPRLRNGHGIAFAWLDYDDVIVECRQLMALVQLVERLGWRIEDTVWRDRLEFLQSFLASFDRQGHLALLATYPEADCLRLDLELLMR